MLTKQLRSSLLLLGLSSGLASLAGCSKAPETAVPTAPAAQQEFVAEEAFPGQTGPAATGKLGSTAITYQQINGEKVYEGDILLTAEQADPTRTQTESAGRNTGRWPGGVVYYTIDGALPDQGRVTNAINHWRTYTAIRFVARTTQANYVTFRPSTGCSSNIGLIGGHQFINLGPGCTTGNTIHEIGHALGLYHEQTREDRDRSVNILFANITTGYEGNFRKYDPAAGTDFGGFDFGSIMLYGSYAFSSNGRPTITRKDGSTFVGQRNGLSAGDKNGINIMY